MTDNDIAASKMLESAGARVANTYELLEKILLHIPRYWNKTLFRAKMTSKSFAAVITRSKNVQTRLLIDLPIDHTSVGTMLWAPKFFKEVITMRYQSTHDRLHLRAVIDLEVLHNLDPFDPTSSWRNLWLARESTESVTVQANLWHESSMTACSFRMSITRSGGITLDHMADLAIELDDLVKFRKGHEISKYGSMLSELNEKWLRQDGVRIGRYMVFETFLDEDGSSNDSANYYAGPDDYNKEILQRSWDWEAQYSPRSLHDPFSWCRTDARRQFSDRPYHGGRYELAFEPLDSALVRLRLDLFFGEEPTRVA